MSLDRDAADRSFDRQLAYLGLLDDAAPMFRDGAQVPGVGVLLALPALIESGLLRISRKLMVKSVRLSMVCAPPCSRCCSWRCYGSSVPSSSRSKTRPRWEDCSGWIGRLK
jgi:hypothetical protein